MLGTEKIVAIASEVARTHLKAANVRQVLVEPASDSEGNDAVRITIVIPAGAATRLKGGAALDVLVQIHDSLRDAGEERFPLVEYATKAELESVGDPSPQPPVRSGRPAYRVSTHRAASAG